MIFCTFLKDKICLAIIDILSVLVPVLYPFIEAVQANDKGFVC